MKLDYQKAKSMGYSDSEINDYVKSKGVELTNAPKKEGLGTFLKGVVEGTGVPKFGANAVAALETLGSMATEKINPDISYKLASNAQKLREYTGTTGSISTPWGGPGQGSAAKTVLNVAAPAVQTGLTATGLTTVAPAKLAKLAVGSGVVSGGVNKLFGGTFSEGAGLGVGAAPAEAATVKILKDIVTSPAAKRIVAKAEENGQKVVDKFNLPKVWGEEAKQISKESVKKVSPKDIMSKAFVKLEDQGLSGSTKEKAVAELQKLAKDAPNNILDTLIKRRGADKMITRNLFGMPKTGTGKNLAVAAYRSALDDVIKGIPELAGLDKKMSLYYKVRDPIAAIVSNRLVQAGGAGLIINKLLGK